MLPFVNFDFDALLCAIIRRHFPTTRVPVFASFLHVSPARSEGMASIWITDQCADIRIHEILNRADTPHEVIEYILIHELLHTEIRPREIDGRLVMHPPEFWEAEARLYPQRQLVWAWFYFALSLWLRHDEKREAMIVKRGWHSTASQRFPTLDDAREVSEANARLMRCV